MPMDPASTSIVAIGFAASIVTLSGLIIESWQVLYDLRGKLKDASKDTHALIEKVHSLEQLFRALELATGGVDIADNIKLLWENRYNQINKDFQEFRSLVEKLDLKMKDESFSGLRFRAHIQSILTERKVARYNGRLESHLLFVGAIQNLIVGDRGFRTVQAIEDTSHTLERLAQDDARYHESVERATAEVQTRLTDNAEHVRVISNELSSLKDTTDNAFSRVEVVGRRTQHVAEAIRTELMNSRRTQSQEQNESKDRILEGISLIQREQGRQNHALQETRIVIEQVRNKADQLIKIGATKQSFSAKAWDSRSHDKARSTTALERTMSLQYLSWNLPIGKLLVETTEDYRSFKCEGYNRTDRKWTRKWEMKIVFHAPAWITSAILQLSYDCLSQSGLTTMSRDFSYNVQNYNPDPLLPRLIEESDLPGLKQFFLDGKGRANDYLPVRRGHEQAIPLLYFAIEEAFNKEYVVEGYQIATDERSIRLIEFLVDQGADVNARTLGRFSDSCQRLIGRKDHGAPRRAEARSMIDVFCRYFKWEILSLVLSDANELDENTIRDVLWGSRVCAGHVIDELASNLPLLSEYFPLSLDPLACWALAMMSLEDKRFRVCIPGVLSNLQQRDEAACIKATKGELHRLWHRYPGERYQFFYWTICEGTVKMVEYIFSDCADVNSNFRLGMSHLHNAIFFRRLDVAELLLERGAKELRPENVFICRQLILWGALQVETQSPSMLNLKNLPERLNMLLEKLVVRAFHTYSHPPYSRDLYLGPEVFSTVVANRPEALRCLLKHQPSLTYRVSGHTALSLAISYGLVETVKSLLESNLPVTEDLSNFREAVKMSGDYLEAEHPRALEFIIVDAWGKDYEYWTQSGTEGIYVDKREYAKDFSHRDLYVDLQTDQTINGLLVEALRDRFDDQEALSQPLSQADRLLQRFLRNTIFEQVAITTLNRLEVLGRTAFRCMRESQYLRQKFYWRLKFLYWRYEGWKYSPRNIFLSIFAYVFCIVFLKTREIASWGRSIEAPPRSLIFGLLVAVLAYQMYGAEQSEGRPL